MLPQYSDQFYKNAINGKKGNLFTRMDAIEAALKHLQVRDVTNYITQIVQENKEIIIPSVLGGNPDPTAADFSGIVISPSGQMIGGVLYSFAVVFEGVVLTGVADAGTPVIVGGGDVFGDTVPSVADHAVTYTGTDGKHIKDSGLRAVGNVDNDIVGIGFEATNSSTGINVIGIGQRAAKNALGDDVIGIGQEATQNSSGSDIIGIGRQALKYTTGSYLIGIGRHAGKYETGGSKLYIDTEDRLNEADSRTGAIIYGVMNDDPALQTLALNAAVTGLSFNGMTAAQVTDLTDTGETTLHSHAASGSQAQILAIASIGF